MKKYLLIIVCLFIFTGCEITYNYDIDSKEEIVNITSSYSNYNKKIYDQYSKKPIPLSEYVPIQSESDIKMKDAKYYDKKDASDTNGINIEFNGKFDKVSIEESTLLSYGSGVINKMPSDKKVSVYLKKNMKLFNQFPDLDKITINIKCKNKVLESNADYAKGNVYTWVITRDNYKNKEIMAVFKTTSRVDEINRPMLRFTIAIVAIVFVGFIIYLIIKRKNKKVNSL